MNRSARLVATILPHSQPTRITVSSPNHRRTPRLTSQATPPYPRYAGAVGNPARIAAVISFDFVTRTTKIVPASPPRGCHTCPRQRCQPRVSARCNDRAAQIFCACLTRDASHAGRKSGMTVRSPPSWWHPPTLALARQQVIVSDDNLSTASSPCATMPESQFAGTLPGTDVRGRVSSDGGDAAAGRHFHGAAVSANLPGRVPETRFSGGALRVLPTGPLRRPTTTLSRARIIRLR